MKRICFTIMPFGFHDEYAGGREEADFVYSEIIRPSVDAAVRDFKTQYGDRIEHELEVIRELENVAPGAITASIVRNIAESHIAIIDLSGRNPNVFLELGIRFALRRNGTILLVQDIAQVPFNVHHFRVVEYKPRYHGIAKARKDLTATVRTTLEVLARPSPPTTDSLVFDALPSLRISGLGFTEESPATGKVSWDEYWARTAHIEEVLSELQATGVYTPDIIIGISNGGLFLADTSLRLVYKNEVPMISLWARRSQEKYFDNPINNAQITPELIKALAPGIDLKRRIRVLVMDDIVGTKRTFTQLVDYLHDRLGDFHDHIEIRFVFLFTPLEETINDLRPYLLSQDGNITSTFKTLELEAVTGKSDLPYRKSIHYGSITPSQDREERDSPRRPGPATVPPKTKSATA
jgi:adenine/guanine phosphoribosyltransferase-like PRPP-binding protein